MRLCGALQASALLVLVVCVQGLSLGGRRSFNYLRDRRRSAQTERRCPSDPALEVVHSRYHGTDHCLCPQGMRCAGTACSTGHVANGDVYRHEIFGFQADCKDCRCLKQESFDDFAAIRAQKMLWVIGSHHKTGSFLASNLWREMHQVIKPSLQVRVNSFHPMTEEKWRKVKPETDVLITYHAVDIDQRVSEWTGRPVRFVHLVRDPLEAVVSAYHYEKQRLEMGSLVHDEYFKIVRDATNETEAQLELTRFMLPDLNAMAEQYKLTLLDSNGLNMRLEDFFADFMSSAHRMFTFLGVPEANMESFMIMARTQDITARDSSKFTNEMHVTTGKVDKEPLRRFLFHQPEFQEVFRRIKQELGYSCCPPPPE